VLAGKIHSNLARSVTAASVSDNAFLFALSSLVFQACKTPGLFPDVFLSLSLKMPSNLTMKSIGIAGSIR
jgi:hypothetical protein